MAVLRFWVFVAGGLVPRQDGFLAVIHLFGRSSGGKKMDKSLISIFSGPGGSSRQMCVLSGVLRFSVSVRLLVRAVPRKMGRTIA